MTAEADLSDTATRQGDPEPPEAGRDKEGFPLEPSEGVLSNLVPRTEREHICCVSH